MTNKLLFPALLVMLLALGVSFGSPGKAQAQTALFPAGCASALGYSATDGRPCNGMSVATNRFMPGCTTPLGYSASTGLPCSGSSIALNWLAGCTSTLGYSSITGEACNGTAFATLAVAPPTVTPGLPTTGAGGNALLNIVLLLSSGIVAAGGSTYLVRNYRKSE